MTGRASSVTKDTPENTPDEPHLEAEIQRGRAANPLEQFAAESGVATREKP
jgi:hypothetical protein